MLERGSNLVGEVKGYGTVWYDPMGIANILSFKRVSEKYVAAYDQTQRAFVVRKLDGKEFLFVESPKGLHNLDTEGDSGTMLLIQ